MGGLSVPDVYNLGNSNNPATTTDSLNEEEVKSLYGYADLAYKNMVYLNVSVRNDWTSTLQPPYNSYFFPSASLGLIVSEMLKMPTAITYAKLRAAYGNVASDAKPYQTLPVYTAGTRWNGVPSLNTPTSIYSSAIQPNRTATREAGLEMKFLKNRLGFDFTYYSYLEKDFIVNIPLSQASGYNSLLVNGNVFERRGIELVLNATPVKTKDFAWEILLNYTRFEEVVKSWYNGAQYGTVNSITRIRLK